MGFLGGNSGRRSDKAADKQTKIAYKAAKDQHKYNWESAQLNYNDAVLSNEIQKRNMEQQLQYQEANAMRSWDFEVQQREAEFNAQMAAYNKSEKLYGAQLGLNRKAYELAAESSTAVRRERLQDVNFQAMDADFKYSQFKSELTSKRHSIDQQKQQETFAQQAKRAEAAFKNEEGLVAMMQAAGSVEAKGQAGRTAKKNYQAVIAAGGRSRAQLLDQVSRADSAYNLTMLGIDKSLIDLYEQDQYSDIGYRLGEKQRDATKLSIHSAYDRSIKKAKHDKYASDLMADSQRMSKPGMAPLPPKPLTLPRAELLDPMIPREPPKPRKGAGSMGAGAAADQARGVGMAFNAVTSIATAFLPLLCDMRFKHEVALLDYTEVNDDLSKLAFAVKELREYS